MATDPGKHAHARLTALAQRRRSFARKRGSLRPEIRRRLHDEVARLLGGQAGAAVETKATEATATVPPPGVEAHEDLAPERKASGAGSPLRFMMGLGRHWRAWVAWAGVAAAAGVMILVIRFPGDDTRMAAHSDSTASPGPVVAESAVGRASVPNDSGAVEGDFLSTAPASAEAEVVRRAAPAPAGGVSAGVTNSALRFALQGLGDAATAVDEPVGLDRVRPESSAALSADSGPATGVTRPSAPVTRTALPAPETAVARGQPKVDLQAAQRLRQFYRAALGSGTVPKVLAAFEVERVRQELQIRDADGSVYVGRATSVRGTDSVAATWAFEARGYSRSLRASVSITGNFGDPGAAKADAGVAVASATAAAAGAGEGDESAPQSLSRSVGTQRLGAHPAGDFLQSPLTATVLVGGTNAFEVRAVPATP